MPELPLNSVLTIAWIPVYLFLAFYYFVFYIRDRIETRHLLFAFLCLSLAHYSLGAAGLYASIDFKSALFWQRFQVIGAIFGFPSIALFIMSSSGFSLRKAHYLGFYLFSVMMAIGDLCTNWIFTTQPMIRNIHVFGWTVKYLDAKPGWLGSLLFFYGLLLIVHSTIFAFISVRRKNTGSMVVFIAMVFLGSCALNDILVASGIYAFLYLTEHGFVVFAFAVAYSLQDQYITAQKERRHERRRLHALNDIMGALNRTNSLDEALESVKNVLSDNLNFEWLGLFLLVKDVHRFEVAGLCGTITSLAVGQELEIDKISFANVLSTRKGGSKGWRSVDISGRLVAKWLSGELAAAGMDATMVLPLRMGNEPVGLLVAAGKEKISYTTEQMALLAHVSEDLAMAVVKLKLIRDLEQRTRELEAANLELKSLDAMKSELLANVSHELKTPLVSIRGYTEMILSGKLGPITSGHEKGLKSCLRNASRLLRMIQDLLDYARLKDGRIIIEKTRLDLRNVLAECIEAAMPRAESLGIEMRKNIDAHGPLWTMGDRGRLIQVFDNLIGNAMKFNVKGGYVLITADYDASLLQKQDEKPGIEGSGISPDEEGRRFIKVTVQDSGVGIPAEQIHLVFDRFYRVRGSSSSGAGGAGIGLAIVKELVSLHDGTVRVESLLGKGTSFMVFLPSIDLQVKKG
ncbi:MAG: hypothetical protein GXP49_12285 [Deltaproteobacteria bacterium]|nr:hypothetical protein [Deltaproteobacteria bacterium]